MSRPKSVGEMAGSDEAAMLLLGLHKVRESPVPEEETAGHDTDDEKSHELHPVVTPRRRVSVFPPAILNHNALDMYTRRIYKYNCYCSQGVEDANAIMIQCRDCDNWYHKACVSAADPYTLYCGERNYVFSCRKCHGSEHFHRLEKPWLDIIRDTLYNIWIQQGSPNAQGEPPCYKLRGTICRFMDLHWDICYGKVRTQSWKNTVVARMSRNRHIFLGTGHGFWSLQPMNMQLHGHCPQLEAMDADDAKSSPSPKRKTCTSSTESQASTNSEDVRQNTPIFAPVRAVTHSPFARIKYTTEPTGPTWEGLIFDSMDIAESEGHGSAARGFLLEALVAVAHHHWDKLTERIRPIPDTHFLHRILEHTLQVHDTQFTRNQDGLWLFKPFVDGSVNNQEVKGRDVDLRQVYKQFFEGHTETSNPTALEHDKIPTMQSSFRPLPSK